MSNYNKVNRVLIGDGANSGAVTSLPGIQAGDLIIIDERHNVLSTVAAAQALARFEKITIASGIGAGIAILSSPIQGNTVSKYEGKSYVAPSVQITILGYNGTASTGISITAGVEYRLRVYVKDDQRVQGMRQTFIDVNYVAATGDTPQSVAYKIACLFGQKDYGVNYAQDKVGLERVSNGTRAAFPVGANATVVNGGTGVSFAAAHGLAVGAIVKFQGASYVVAAVPSATTITLDVPYAGISETILVADADTGVYTVVTEWGFKLTGKNITSRLSRGANEPVDQYEWVIFDAAFTDANDLASSQYSALATKVQAVKAGQGYWKQVADREEEAKGYLGDTSKRRFDDFRINSVVVPNTSYGSVVITHADVMGGDFQGQYSAPLQTEIYIPASSAQGDATPGNNEFLALLNGFFSDVLGFTAIPTL